MPEEEFSVSKFAMEAINRAIDHAAASIKAEKDRENKKGLMGGTKTKIKIKIKTRIRKRIKKRKIKTKKIRK